MKHTLVKCTTAVGLGRYVVVCFFLFFLFFSFFFSFLCLGFLWGGFCLVCVEVPANYVNLRQTSVLT